MIRKIADYDLEACDGKYTLNLDDLTDVFKGDNMVMDHIWDCMCETDRGQAWNDFMRYVEDDIKTFLDDSYLSTVISDLGDGLDDENMYYNAGTVICEQISEYISWLLYDDFTGMEGSDDQEVYGANGWKILDKLNGDLSGKHLTIYFTVKSGEIE